MPAFAHVVEVTTSIGLQDTSDPDRLQGDEASAGGERDGGLELTI